MTHTLILLVLFLFSGCAAIATDGHRAFALTILANNDRLAVSGTSAEIVGHNVSNPIGTALMGAAMFRFAPMLRP